MNLRGVRFHMNELGIDSQEIEEALRGCVNDGDGIHTIVVSVEALVSEADIECIIEGSTFDRELLQPYPPTMELLSDVKDVKGLSAVVEPPVENYVKVTEFVEIEPVTNWFGEVIPRYFRVVDISAAKTFDNIIVA